MYVYKLKRVSHTDVSNIYTFSVGGVVVVVVVVRIGGKLSSGFIYPVRIHKGQLQLWQL